MTPGRCIVVGDLMMDVTARVSSPLAYASDTPARVSMQPGGAAANTAAWLAGTGRPVELVGCVGDDPAGRLILDGLARRGVGASHVRVVPTTSTGACVVLVDEHGERTMLPDSGANGFLTAADLAALEPGPADYVHLSGYVLINPASRDEALAVIALANAAGALLSLDPASADPLTGIRDLVWRALVDVPLVIANAEEATVLTGSADPREAARRLAEHCGTAVVKRGPAGVVAAEAGRVGLIEQAALAGEVVDTTGAGDAFAAGLLDALMAGSALDRAVHGGQQLAVRAVSRVGAQPDLPAPDRMS